MKYFLAVVFLVVSGGCFAQIDTLKFWNEEYFVLRNDTVIYPPILEAERATEFAGGTAGMGTFIAKTLRVPMKVRRQKVNGRVTAIFRVDKYGMIKEITLRGDTTLDRGDEARRVVEAFPRWKPALQNRRVVPMRMAVNIDFRVDGAKNK